MRGPLVAAVLLGPACREGERPELREDPVLVPAERAPLSAELTVRTTSPTRLEVRLRGHGVHLDLAFPGLSDEHVVPLHGVRPDTDVRVEVRVESATGRARTETLHWTTPALPADLPEIELRDVDRGRVYGGWLLLPLRDSDDERAWLVAIDPRDGEVAWWYDGPWQMGIVAPTGDGTSLVAMASSSIVQFDWLGRDVARWSGVSGDPEGATPIEAQGMHHDVRRYGEVLAVLTHESKEVPGYPISYAQPTVLEGPAVVEDSVLSLFDADTGATRARFPMSAVLDTARIGFNGLEEERYGFDWAHANAFLPWGDGWLVEMRHQDGYVALDAAGDARWILSNPDGWGAAWRDRILGGLGPADWPFHPHGPSVDHDGNLVLLDNHNDGHNPYQPDPGLPERSRVIAYAIDEEAHTARRAWSWTPPGGLFSNGLGNATALPSGHVVANFPLLVAQDGVANAAAGRGQTSARVFEIVPGEADPVFDLDVYSLAREAVGGVHLYRAVPFRSFWGDGVEVTK